MPLSNETLFQFLSFSPGPFWLLIVFFTKKRWSVRVVNCYLFLLCGIFAALTIPWIVDLLPLIAQPEYNSIKAFITSDSGFIGSWNHMIIGDLWIGSWVARDTLRFKNSLIFRLIFIPPILFFGPFGVFLYLVMRIIRTRSLEFNT